MCIRDSNHVGINDKGEIGRMYFNRTLEDWIGYRIDNRTKFDLTISAGLALLAAQTVVQKQKTADFSGQKFFRKYTYTPGGVSKPSK